MASGVGGNWITMEILYRRVNGGFLHVNECEENAAEFGYDLNQV